jgi:hypothetical protein
MVGRNLVGLFHVRPQEVMAVSFHRNVYDLLDLSPDVSTRAERMIERHERQHGPLPAAVREWYCVKGIVPMTDRKPAPPSIWKQYSNTDPPEPLSRVLRRAARLDGRPAGRLVRLMGECQNAGDWRAEYDGSDDPPVWSYDPYHRDPGEEYLLAAPTFSEFVWNWVAEFHQFYRRFQPLPDQPHIDGEWAAGSLSGPAGPIVAALTAQLGKPETATVGFGQTRTEFQADGAIARLTHGGSSSGVAFWASAATTGRLRHVTRMITPNGAQAASLRTSRRNYEGARNGRPTRRGA